MNYRSKTFWMPPKDAIERVKEHCDEKVESIVDQLNSGELTPSEAMSKVREAFKEGSNLISLIRRGGTRRDHDVEPKTR